MRAQPSLLPRRIEQLLELICEIRAEHGRQDYRAVWGKRGAEGY